MDLREITQNENRHPWELSRTKNVLQICKEKLPSQKTLKIADVGAGDRYFDKQLISSLKSEDIKAIIFTVDNEYRNFSSSEEDIVLLNDINKLENNSMDAILLMDVLEHVEDDKEFFKALLNKLTSSGIIIITVPAFQNLFSSHDQYLKHFRRYDYKELKEILYANDLQIEQSHYFYTLLYVTRWIQCLLEKAKSQSKGVGIGTWKYNQGSFITRSIEMLLNIDFRANIFLSKLGIRLPGLSLLAVARRNIIENN